MDKREFLYKFLAFLTLKRIDVDFEYSSIKQEEELVQQFVAYMEEHYGV